MGDFLMDAEGLADAGRGQPGVVGEDAEGAGVGAGADAPDVEVGQLRLAIGRQGGDDVADFGNDRVIHFAIEQDPAALHDQVLGPDSNQHGADDAGRRVEPGPAVEPAASQRGDREDRGGGVGQDMDIGGLQVEVVVVVLMAMALIVPMVVMMVAVIVGAIKAMAINTTTTTST